MIKKILIIDDEIEIVELLQRFLKLEGFKVDYVLNAQDSLNVMKKNMYSLILCDIKLLDMSGEDLIKKLKEYNPLVSIIMITAYSSMEKVVSCIEKGAVDYFTKPFSGMDKLIEVVNYHYEKIKRWHKLFPYFEY